MASARSFWYWLPVERQWRRSNPQAASYAFVQYGEHVVWRGTIPPFNGCDPCDFNPLLRHCRWARFLALTEAKPSRNHRIDQF